MLEMQAAKLAASIGNVEINPTGELDVSALRRSKLKIATTGPTGNAITKDGDQFYKVTMGTNNIALKVGDSLQQFMINRPTVATQGYWDLLISQVCCAYNVPKLLVVPYSLQGTVTRADLDVCANAFRTNFEIVRCVVEEVYEWHTEWAVKFDRGMDGKKPADYLACIIRPPRAPNVDIGYTAQALALELEVGTKTIQDVYAERQQDWREQLRQIAETEGFINDLAKEFGISPERIANKVLKSKPAAAAKEDLDGEDAKNQPKETTV
jgi:hypothetical protein